MALNRNATNFRRRDEALGYVTPKVILNENVVQPVGPSKSGWLPAPWLPIQFSKSTDVGGTDYFVISSGKVVALTTEGHLVPAGILTLLQAGASALSYTATDVAQGVIDLTTGLAVTAAVTYSTVQVAQALLERGLITSQDYIAAGGTNPPTTNTHGNFAIQTFISPPVGFAPYDFYKWSGKAEDADMFFTNYSKQSNVGFMTEAVLELPHLVAASGTDSFAVDTLNTAGTATAATGDQVRPTEYWNATNLAALTRYSLMGITASSEVVALGIDAAGSGTQFRLARNTDRTPFTCDTAGVLVRERTSPALITREGDWYLDAELGVLFLHSDTWATGVAAIATWVFSYSYYDGSGADGHKMVHFDGAARPGLRVTFDSQSNYELAVEGTTAERNIVGRVLAVNVQAQGLLKHVKTGFPGASSAMGKLPGSATKGFPDKITLSPEVVADQLVTILVRV